MYKVEISPQARRELRKLKIRYRLSISTIIDDLKENPFMGKPLSRDFLGRYSYRVGVCRIIYRVNVREKLVEVITAGHRSVIYN
jgi:mRNA interferase RelE/StbE